MSISPYNSQRPPKPEKKRMGKGKKAAIVLIPIVGFVTFLMIVGSQPYINTNVSEIEGIKSFVVLHDEGNLYNARFSLIDNGNLPAASDAKVSYRICNMVGNLDVSASEFKTYQLQLTGQEFIAYAWFINEPETVCDDFDYAYLTVTLPDGRVFKADERVFSG